MSSSEQFAPPPASGSRTRWAKFRSLSSLAQILLILFAWPLVVLYLLPWERFWVWFRQLPPRTQKITAVVAVVAFVAMIAVGGVASEREKNRQEAAAASEQEIAAREESKSPSTVETPAIAEPAIESSEDASEPTSEAPDPVYAGKLEDDAHADAQGQVEVRGLTATVGPLRRVDEPSFGPRLCSDLTLDNRSSETQWYYVDIEMSIQYPSGNEKGVVLVYDNDLGSGNLVPDGHASGQVCFVDRGEVGQHLVLWNRKEASFSTPRRGVWLFTV